MICNSFHVYIYTSVTHIGRSMVMVRLYLNGEEKDHGAFLQWPGPKQHFKFGKEGAIPEYVIADGHF